MLAEMAMKTVPLTSIAALFLATGTAHARDEGHYEKVRAQVIRPHKYDHPYPGRTTIIRYGKVKTGQVAAIEMPTEPEALNSFSSVSMNLTAISASDFLVFPQRHPYANWLAMAAHIELSLATFSCERFSSMMEEKQRRSGPMIGALCARRLCTSRADRSLGRIRTGNQSVRIQRNL
jgi:hypothetical protein